VLGMCFIMILVHEIWLSCLCACLWLLVSMFVVIFIVDFMHVHFYPCMFMSACCDCLLACFYHFLFCSTLVTIPFWRCQRGILFWCIPSYVTISYVIYCYVYLLVWCGFLYDMFHGEISPHHQHAFDIIKKGEIEDDIAFVIGFCFYDV
jgi:hypothetical protein